MLNDNKYSFSVKDNVMNLTVVRSPLYGDHGRGRDKECKFTDQKMSEFCYSLMPINKNGWNDVIREAKQLNLPLSYVIENNHEGALPQRFCGLECNCKNVFVSALKLAEDGKGVVIRIHETDGKNTLVTLCGTLLPKPLVTDIGAYEVNTYYYSYETHNWKPVLLTEYDM